METRLFTADHLAGDRPGSEAAPWFQASASWMCGKACSTRQHQLGPVLDPLGVVEDVGVSGLAQLRLLPKVRQIDLLQAQAVFSARPVSASATVFAEHFERNRLPCDERPDSS